MNYSEAFSPEERFQLSFGTCCMAANVICDHSVRIPFFILAAVSAYSLVEAFRYREDKNAQDGSGCVSVKKFAENFISNLEAKRSLFGSLLFPHIHFVSHVLHIDKQCCIFHVNIVTARNLSAKNWAQCDKMLLCQFFFNSNDLCNAQIRAQRSASLCETHAFGLHSWN